MKKRDRLNKIAYSLSSNECLLKAYTKLEEEIKFFLNKCRNGG